jgi:glutamate--cysteine ligase
MTRLDTLLCTCTPLAPQLLRGVEKESLRVRPDGTLAATAHPAGLGSALTHPNITTDFSEAQIELVTDAHPTPEACLEDLRLLHRYTYGAIGDELLWCSSMPCELPPEHEIPLAHYGRSNVARAKTVYRSGLSYRYGRRMQMISGVHYNFSVTDAALQAAGFAGANEAYFALIRNFRRRVWLLLYLFGASPAVCAGFVAGREHPLTELAPGTLYLPHATSLRMGRLGYLSAAQDALNVSYNCLESYGASLSDALTRPYPPYEAIGIRDGDDYRQLATSLLQIENEFYGTIRPKRVILPGERPLHALRERGVQYVEVRVMDLDPFAAIGIAPQTARFLDAFLLHCLLADSPPDTPQEIRALGANQQLVATRGREPGLQLTRDGREVALAEWAASILDACAPVAAALDAGSGGDAHAAALAAARRALDDPDALPSARALAEMREQHGGSYARFVLANSRRHRAAVEAGPLPPAQAERLARLAQASLAEQAAEDAAEGIPFEAFRRQYLAPESLVAG